MGLCGPFPKASIHGHRYFLTIVDDYSRRVFAYPLKTKSDVFNTFSRFQKRAERFLDRKIKFIRTDNGLEFINEQFHNFCDELGIKHERTNTYTPQQNGGYRIWLPESHKIIETINVRFDESTPVKVDSNNHKFERVEAVLDPDYVTNKIPLRTASYIDNDEIVLYEIDRESKSSDENCKASAESSESNSFSEKGVNWIRKPIPRTDGKRTDIYYYEEGKKQRLRPLKEVEDYCSENKLKFQPDIFNFTATDTYSGIISENYETSSSMSTE
ncbi:Retrovirus-related Pol polyprotein from transposon TNT 1-94 [Araneus ventricosus]|uniref:Retrovirus-related Pol polyprotein from transposon TNT 1-94 n=1 Tax=Araneus ventricosus TaxID=182803 RepID=A0A4Y2ERI5_ARAVE|nr:Retrovirus-related Pol polyprotein from transposon TNT 1-94 [Araneus ventricosus]